MAMVQPESFTLEIESHPRDSFKILEHMQKERVLCDVTLVAKDLEIPAHRNVLASCSPYFYSIFTDLQSAEQQRIELDMNPQILLSVISYMYTSKLSVTEDEVMELYEVTKMLLLSSVQVECSNILEQVISPRNCFNVKRIASKYEDTKLLNTASSYIDDNFIYAIGSEAYLNLTSEEITELISRDTLRMSSEEIVYECIVRWIKHDSKGRRKYLRVLMGYVRLRFISKDYLNQHIIEDSFLRGDCYCKDLIIKAFVEEYVTVVPKSTPRRYDTKVLLLIGGDQDDARNSLEYYDFGTKCWSDAIKIPFHICHTNLTVANQTIYLIGGDRNNRVTQTVNYYDINTNSWNEIDKMTMPRRRHSVGVSNSCIYAVGGSNNINILNSVEKFDFQTERWSPIAPMLSERSLLGAVVLNDILYAVGGDDENYSTLNSVERYDQRTDSWKELSSMNDCRNALGVCTLDGKLYAIGGQDGEKFLSSVEVYSPDTDTWTLITPMLIARGYHNVAVLDNKIYVTGGCNKNVDGALNSTEVYDKDTNLWTLLPKDMNIARNSHAAAIVAQLINKFMCHNNISRVINTMCKI